MTIAPTAATTLQVASTGQSSVADESRFAADIWRLIPSLHASDDLREASSEILGSGYQYSGHGIRPLHGAQTESDVPMSPDLLLSYRMLQFLATRIHGFTDLSQARTLNAIDPMEGYRAESIQRFQEVSEVRLTYQRRIEELGRYGLVEGITVNEDSERDFWAFVDSTGFSSRAGLVLMDNGDLRAVWRGDDQSHLALHFLGHRLVRYVIFKRRPATRHVSRSSGTDTMDGVKQQIRDFGLVPLVNG